MTDLDSNPGKWAIEQSGAAASDSSNLGDSLMMSQWPNPDGILAWILYSLGCAFLVSDDKDSVREILKILRDVDNNLAALLSSKVD
jgi:selenophosphate synthetase-related protein